MRVRALVLGISMACPPSQQFAPCGNDTTFDLYGGCVSSVDVSCSFAASSSGPACGDVDTVPIGQVTATHPGEHCDLTAHCTNGFVETVHVDWNDAGCPNPPSWVLCAASQPEAGNPFTD